MKLFVIYFIFDIMYKTLNFRGIKSLYEVHSHRELINSRVWRDRSCGFRCSEHTYRMWYEIGGLKFDTLKIEKFGARVTEIWIDAHGRRVYSEKQCLESFINDCK